MSNPSTLTPQNLIDYARNFSWTVPALGVAGYSEEPALSFCDDIMKRIMARANPWKWNMVTAPLFYTQPYQQDYPTNISQATLGWLRNATMIDINNFTSLPPVQPPLTCVQNLMPTSNCGYPSKVCWMPNQSIITGIWLANQVYVNPLVTSGGGPSSNPITAITDSNGNIQLVTTYGVTGSTAPTWPAAGTTPGTTTTDGSVVWTLMDPEGVAFRVDQLATFNSVVWEMHVLYQAKPPDMVSLNQTFSPIPNDLNFLIKQGFLAYCYKQVDNDKFQQEYAQWMTDTQEAMGASDRELQEFGFYPSNPVQGTGGSMTGGYGYPGWWGWNSDGN